MIENSEEPPTEPERGRFVFLQGDKRRGATAKRAPVVWGVDQAKVLAEVLRRTRELATNGEGHVWVAAYPEGAKHPAEEVRVLGTTDEEDEDGPPSSGDAIASLTWALVRTNQQILGENQDLRRTVQDYHRAAIELTEQMTLVTAHSRMLEDSQSDESMKQAIEAFSPTLERIAPVIAAWAFGGGGLPEDPTERVREGVRRTMAAVQDVSETLRAHPEVAQVPGIVDPLVELVTTLGPRLGFRVERIAQPPPPAEPPPPPPKGRRKKTDQPTQEGA